MNSIVLYAYMKLDFSIEIRIFYYLYHASYWSSAVNLISPKMIELFLLHNKMLHLIKYLFVYYLTYKAADYFHYDKKVTIVMHLVRLAVLCCMAMQWNFLEMPLLVDLSERDN